MEEAVPANFPDITSVLLSHLEAGELRLDLSYWMLGKMRKKKNAGRMRNQEGKGRFKEWNQTNVDSESLCWWERDRCIAIGRKKEKTKGVGWGAGRAGPSVAVASLSSPRWSFGGFPENPAVLNKGQSSTRQCIKTCCFSSLPSNLGWNFEGETAD